MSAIITRSALVFHGHNPPPELAYVHSDGWGRRRVVTWDDVMRARRERQARQLAWKRRVDERRGVLPAYVWVFHNDWVIPYGGWYCYVVTRRFDVAVNFQGFQTELAESIMRAAPCGVLPVAENFEEWMPAFARRYPRNHPRDPREAGSLVGWLEDRARFKRAEDRKL